MKVGLSTIMFIVFLVLKLTGFVAWPWVWVTAPLWIPAAILLVFLAVAFLIAVAAVAR